MTTTPRPEGKRDQGFTLIELLVVVLIIGVLAAIAIPVFLSQREKAADAATKSDLKNAATLMETHFVDAQTYAATDDPDARITDRRVSETVTITIVSANTEGFCLMGENDGGSADFYYDSGAGGLLTGEDTCVEADYA